MYQSEFIDAIDNTMSGVKSNIETLRAIGGSLESIRVSIESDGMSRELAELLEQKAPGSITSRARINGFTQYPSNVGKAVGLESIFTARNISLSAVIAAVAAGVIALLARFVKWINDITKGPDAKARAKRAHSREWASESDHLGAGVPGWEDDPVFQAANRALQDTLTKLVIYVGNNRHEVLVRSLVGPGPRTLVEYISNQIAMDLKTVRTLTESVLSKSSVGDGIVGNDALLTQLGETLKTLEGNLQTTESLSFQGLVGDFKEPLSVRIIKTREFYESMADQPVAQVREITTMREMDAIRATILKSQRTIENIKYDKTQRTLVSLLRELTATKDNVKVKLGAGTERASALMVDMLAVVQVHMNILADVVAVIGTIVGSVTTAESQSVQQMQAAVDALSAAGVSFSDNDPRWAKERAFKDMVDSLS